MTDTPRVTVAIPVGPLPIHREWLHEALDSVWAQTYGNTGGLIIDDMAGLDPSDYLDRSGESLLSWVKSSWLLGVASAFNHGVALAKTELVFMLGADDWLEPTCIERCVQEYLGRPEERRDLGYYFTSVRYTDGREDQLLACNAAMVTKTLWRATGGFAPETGVGAPDAALISVLLVRPELADLIPVDSPERPLYNHRIHPGQDTAGRAPYQTAIHQVRDVLTRDWSAPKWGRDR